MYQHALVRQAGAWFMSCHPSLLVAEQAVR